METLILIEENNDFKVRMDENLNDLAKSSVTIKSDGVEIRLTRAKAFHLIDELWDGITDEDDYDTICRDRNGYASCCDELKAELADLNERVRRRDYRNIV